MSLKSIIIFLSLTCLFIGCTNPKQGINQAENNCPSSPGSPPKFKVKNEGDFFEKLKTLNIEVSKNIITFQTQDYDFVFCNSDNTFITKRGTYQPEEKPAKNYEEAIEELNNPSYKIINWQDKTYQYRVILDPNPFPDFEVESEKVILELITPEAEKPQKHILYTLEQVKKQQAGIQLGVPEVTASVINNNQFYWSVSSEQGEGNGGIATIVNYDPQENSINLIQPSQIAQQQINDLKISNNTDTTFWLATQISGEGNPYLPGMGLISYNTKSKSLKSYHARNSKLVGMIPYKLTIEEDKIWVATGNGICQIKWQEIDQENSWKCWEFKLQAEIPSGGLEVYQSLLSSTSSTTINTDENNKIIEVLWWSPQDYEADKGRYEVVYNTPFSVTLDDKGAMNWKEIYDKEYKVHSWEAMVYWPGKDWLWNGNRFIRPFDGVSLNYFGGGPGGISSWKNPEKQRPEIYAIRGDLDLINLTKNSTNVKYYSGWVEDSLLDPYLTIVPTEKLTNIKPNPLKKFPKD
ncbi:hypothetical protein [Crocosphaera chwakensis]|uniref:Lipoprotein n=1 Tax=Crocosphaera chwakensis CCY0110 TaxID=391612 RepID=A3INT6_9CHRO|nr:hypothetical protein [Crocosphaera chwakensis]EAZ91984.1 hypothetical protein CY0110_29954 [Crocosphaera chwakensis CCY0110]